MAHVTNCIWPDTPPDGVTLDEETYPDNKGNYLAVAKLVVDWDAGTAGADPTFDQSSCGTPVSNFTSADVLTGLRTNAGTGIEWVAGINHPTFAWDVWHIPADYTKFIEAIAAFVTKVETSPFSDVSTSAYYYEAVKWAQEKGITGGIGNGLFGPNQPCTRAQIVTFLWRAAGSPVVNYAMNMSDVPEGSYYAEAVRWALSEGIATGTTEKHILSRQRTAPALKPSRFCSATLRPRRSPCRSWCPASLTPIPFLATRFPR